jgi:hypothetical protein
VTAEPAIGSGCRPLGRVKGAGYPAGREDLVAPARDNGADDALVEKLTNAPEDEAR